MHTEGEEFWYSHIPPSMPSKYKNDLAKCYALLKFDLNWKTTCEDNDSFNKALNLITTELVIDQEDGIESIRVDMDPTELPSEIEKFLADYGCPYPSLVETPLDDRFTTVDNRMLLLRYLSTELMAKRQCKQIPLAGPQSKAGEASEEASRATNMEMTVHLTRACRALKLPASVVGFDVPSTFSVLGKTVSEAMKRCPPMHLGTSMLPLTGLSDRQWSQISHIAGLLQQEYTSRRATLLKRLDVTVQSFKWSDKAKAQLAAIAAVYQPIRARMSNSEFPGMAELLAVRDNMVLRYEKTSGCAARRYTSCPLNKILIGKVPDRGGRAWELEPPPPEMPGFKQRQPDQGRGGRGRGFGDSSRGRGFGDSSRGRGFGDSSRGRGYDDSGRGRGFGGGGGQNGQTRGNYQPPAFQSHGPSAARGGGDYIVPPTAAAYNALANQMSGLAFEPGLAMGQHQAYVFQPGNFIAANPQAMYQQPMQRGHGYRGGRPRGRPY